MSELNAFGSTMLATAVLLAAALAAALAAVGLSWALSVKDILAARRRAKAKRAGSAAE